MLNSGSGSGFLLSDYLLVSPCCFRNFTVRIDFKAAFFPSGSDDDLIIPSTVGFVFFFTSTISFRMPAG